MLVGEPSLSRGTPRFQLRELEAFVAVAACRSFTLASRDLRFDQSTVSRHVAQLERELHLVLLCRSADGVELTQHGEAFLPHARRMIDAAGQAADFADDLRRENTEQSA
jgi:DNA-binding transcriptional LysR family regulator